MNNVPCTEVRAEVVLDCRVSMRDGDVLESIVPSKVCRDKQQVNVDHVVNNSISPYNTVRNVTL